MYKLLWLPLALLPGVLADQPVELNLTIRLGNSVRNIPARCVENSVTAVSCNNVSNSDALVAHPDDCQLFYYCEWVGAPPTCRQCPAGLHFNPTLHVCDWPRNAGCTARPPTTTEQPTTPPSNVTWPWWPTNSTQALVTNSTDSPVSNSSDATVSNSTNNWSTNTTWPWWPTNSTDSPVSNSSEVPASNITDNWSTNTTWPWRPTNSTDSPVSNSTEAPASNSTDNWSTNSTWPWRPTNSTVSPISNSTEAPASNSTRAPFSNATNSTSTTTAGTRHRTTIRWNRLN